MKKMIYCFMATTLFLCLFLVLADAGETPRFFPNNAILYKEGWVYYQDVPEDNPFTPLSTYQDASIYKVKPDGSQKSRLFNLKSDTVSPGNFMDFNFFDIDGDWLYFTKTFTAKDGHRESGGGAVFKFNITSKQLIQLNEQYSFDPVLYKGFVYYRTDARNAENTKIGKMFFKVNVETREDIKLNDTIYSEYGDYGKNHFVIYNDNVYIRTQEFRGNKLQAPNVVKLDINGNTINTFENVDSIYDIIDETIYYGTADGMIYSIRTNGTEKKLVSNNTWEKNNPVVADGVIYFSTSVWNVGVRNKLDPYSNVGKSKYGRIYSINLSDGKENLIYEEKPCRIVAVFNDTVYFKQWEESSKSISLRQMNLDGQDVKKREF